MLRIAFATLFVAAVAAIAASFGMRQIEPVLIAGLGCVLITMVGRKSYAAMIPRRNQPVADRGDEPVIAALSEPVLLTVDGRVRQANEAARALLGAHILGEDARLAIRHPAATERLGAGAVDGSTELVGLGGRDQRIAMHVATLAPGRRLIHLVDRTMSHAAERARVDFVANASHELRTPLAAIIGFIETLDDPQVAADRDVRDRFLQVMMKEARRMQRLIDDLISLSRIEAEKNLLPATPVAMGGLIDEVAGELRDEDGSARADLHLAIDDDLPPVVGDRTQLSQVVHNLVGNALKYGRAGAPVTIALRLEGPSLLRLSITDRGDGIAPEHIPRLTERFYRVDPGRSRAMGGTGLGLAIVKHIVERHRGRLDIASTQGVGTTVSVLLPTVARADVTETSQN